MSAALQQALAGSPQGFVAFARTADLQLYWPELAGTWDSHLLAHAFKARALGQWLGVDHRHLAFGHGTFGRPLLQGDIPCDLSLSHVEIWLAVGAVPEGTIGVDVQSDRVDIQWQVLAANLPELFPDPTATAPNLRNRWCHCESLGKATGAGLAGGVEAGLALTCRVVELSDDTSGAWCWSQTEPPRVWLLSRTPDNTTSVQELAGSSSNQGRQTV
ncbi:4'-phosphopantetheinyl transferase family protein [Rhodovibrio salinarum]|uniref:4'-phosphopantetheinyl transferase superfamily protein n=1 Tax=Rhodovibrio salinarum TaxID=1087 RepID=A0A934QJY9_9PROT|nr:hypothetical protein [Rhodovibrio salinarum]MBK1698236.1 hypothetical protein [Rhodovibrio salinarum]